MTLDTIPRWRRRAARAAALLLAAGSLTAGLAQPAAAIAVRQPLTGLERASNTTEITDSPIKVETVTCPGNKTVVGTGWSTSPSTSQLRLQLLLPRQHSVTASVHEDYDWYDRPWTLTVYAMCADSPPGWSLSSHQTSTNSDTYHNARAECPGATVPLGVGVEQSNGQGEIVVNDINLDLTGVFVSAYEPEDGSSDDWWIRAYAICADPPTGWELQSSSNQTSYPSTNELTGCSAGRTAISAGADLDGAHGEVVLTGLRTYVYQDDELGHARATEDETGTPDDWTLAADVICVQP